MKAREILEELTQNTMGNPPYRIDQALTQLKSLLPSCEEIANILWDLKNDRGEFPADINIARAISKRLEEIYE